MNREEETRGVLEVISETVYHDPSVQALGEMAILGQIAILLAVIADRMGKGDDQKCE